MATLSYGLVLDEPPNSPLLAFISTGERHHLLSRDDDLADSLADIIDDLEPTDPDDAVRSVLGYLRYRIVDGPFELEGLTLLQGIRYVTLAYGF